MKKFYTTLKLLLLLISLIGLRITGFGQTALLENFDGGALPSGWTSNSKTDGSGIKVWLYTNTNSRCATVDHTSGTGKYAMLDDYNISTSENPINLTTIAVDLSMNSYALEFYAYIGASAGTTPIKIDVSTDGGTNWNTDIYSITKATTTTNAWVKHFVNLSSYNTATVKIRFKGYSSYGFTSPNNSGIDDIKVFVPLIPDAVPTSFSATAVSKTGMTVNWIDNSTNETGFRVYMSTDNITYNKYGSDIASTTTGTTATPYSQNITGLAFGKTYYFKIVAFAEGETSALAGNQATSPGDPGDAAPTSMTFTSVGLTAMTIGWTDNSTNETTFKVFKATDIAGPYTQIGTDLSSTTTATTGTIYSLPITGLTSTTTYYFRISAVCDLESTYLTGSKATNAPIPMSGVYTVGHAGANYQTLSAAFADITGNGLAGPVQLALQADFDAYDESTFPIVPSKIATATNPITIYPAVSGVTIDYSSATGLFNFDGVKYVTLDGRIGGIGTTKDLIIKNGSMSSYVIQFTNDATNNTIQYCYVKGGSNTNTIGLINFSGTTGTAGNSNNLIDNCDIAPSVVSFATGVYSNGQTTGKENRNNTVSNCNIYNFRSSAANPNGIYLASYNTDWTISGNSFYQTMAYAAYAYTTYGIYISSGNNHTITNNFIGGRSSICGGSAWTVNGTMAASKFVGIYLSIGTTTATSLQNNTIQNFAWWTTSGSSSYPGVWSGIYLALGNANIGTITGNTIGNNTGTGSINICVSSSPAIVYGIVSAGTTYSISNNRIGSITTSSITSAGVASTTNSIGVIGIATVGSGTAIISGNTIGSLIDANSINASTASSATSGQAIIGIWHSASASSSITNNTIANINNASTGTGTTTVMTQIRGILIGSALTTSVNTTASTNIITGNTIRNLSIASPYTGTTSTAVAIGMEILSSAGNQTIAQNSIYNISNTASTGNVSLMGIYTKLATSVSNTIERNLIHTLSASTSGNGVITGIFAGYGGTCNFQNNIIDLGNSVTNNIAITGIEDNIGTNNYYFNSVYIGGTITAGATSTYAFNSSITSNTRNFKNNIFVNGRINGGSATAKHYAIRLAGNTVNPAGLSCDNNIILASGVGGVFGYFNSADVANLAAWQTAVGQDSHSLNADPKFVDPTNTTPDLHLQGGSPADMAGVDIPTITTDFFGDIRSSLTPTDIGADAGNFDNVAPTATILPTTGVSGVSLGTNVTFTFSENVRKVDNSAIDASVVTFQNTTDVVAVPFTFDYTNKVLTVTPNSPLLALKNYTVTVTGIEDFNDNALSGSNSTSFTTEVGDIIAPTYTSSSVENSDPSNVVVVFSENIKLTSDAGFTIKVDGSPVAINSYSGNNTSTLTFVLSAPITSHQSVTIEYAQASGNVTDITGNALADFAATNVTNNTKSSAKEFVTFNLLKTDNSSLTNDVIGVMGSNSVDLYVPIATDVTNLKASFTTSAYTQKVEIGTTLQVSGTTSNNFTTSLTYKVTAEDNTSKDFTVTIHHIFATPYSQSFDDASFPPTEWTILNAGTGYSWYRSGTSHTGAGSMYHYPHTTNAANTWAFTPAFDLVAGKTYVVEFWEKSSGSLWTEKMKVTVGHTPNVEAQTTEIWKDENITNTSFSKIKETYIAPTSGIYHFGFNCYSNANQYNLYVDDIAIREIGNNAQLSSLKVDGTTVSSFNANTDTYNVELAYGTTAVPQISEATLADINASKLLSQAINLTGTLAERTAKVDVTAEDGVTIQTYSVIFTVAKNNVATLTDLKVDGTTVSGFTTNSYAYNVELPYGTTDVPQITEASLTDANASKVVTQAINLTGTAAERTAKVEVTAENGIATHTYSITFTIGLPTTYAVNFSVIGSNGTITATVESVSISSGDFVIKGKDVSFSATPASGYRVKEWKYNTTVVSGNTTNTFTITDLTAAATVTVEFEAIPPTTYAVNFSVAGANGTLAANVDANAITTGAQVIEGKDVVFTASPANGYRVKEWKNNGVVLNGNNTNTYTLNNLIASANVSVEFETIPPVTYAVNFSVIGVNGTLAASVDAATISSGNQVIQGKNIVFTATPVNGYKVKEWKMNSVVVSGNTTNTFTLTNLTSTASVSVEFEIATGINNPDATTIKIYPNPFTSLIKVSNGIDIAQVQIISITGQVLKTYISSREETITIEASNLTNGVYIIRFVDSKGKVNTQKIIKR